MHWKAQQTQHETITLVSNPFSLLLSNPKWPKRKILSCNAYVIMTYCIVHGNQFRNMDTSLSKMFKTKIPWGNLLPTARGLGLMIQHLLRPLRLQLGFKVEGPSYPSKSSNTRDSYNDSLELDRVKWWFIFLFLFSFHALSLLELQDPRLGKTAEETLIKLAKAMVHGPNGMTLPTNGLPSLDDMEAMIESSWKRKGNPMLDLLSAGRRDAQNRTVVDATEPWHVTNGMLFYFKDTYFYQVVWFC